MQQHAIYERARLARDRRFDGQFYVGVITTGIYCRPICPANATLSLRLHYRAPFDWNALLGYFKRRATPGVEEVIGDCYQRTLSINNKHTVVEVRPNSSAGSLLLTLRSVETPALFETVRQARDVFDLDAPVAEIVSALAPDPLLKRLLRTHRGLRVPGAWDGFELTVRAILGQQVSVKAATTLAGRIAERYGEPLDKALAGQGDLRFLFPTAERLSRARFNKIGLVQSRADTLRRVASAVVRGDLQFDTAQDAGELRSRLISIKGIGEWTAQYVAMRVLKNPDAFPDSDLGLLKALRYPERVTPSELSRHAERWRPWRAYAAMLLWHSLSTSGG